MSETLHQRLLNSRNEHQAIAGELRNSDLWKALDKELRKIINPFYDVPQEFRYVIFSILDKIECGFGSVWFHVQVKIQDDFSESRMLFPAISVPMDLVNHYTDTAFALWIEERKKEKVQELDSQIERLNKIKSKLK